MSTREDLEGDAYTLAFGYAVENVIDDKRAIDAETERLHEAIGETIAKWRESIEAPYRKREK